MRVLGRLFAEVGRKLDLANAERQRWMMGHAPALRAGESGAVVWMNLPGASPEDVDVSVRREGVLVVSGVGSRGAFYREAPLPEGMDLARVFAYMRKETLRVTFSGERGTCGLPERVAVERA